MTRRAVCIVAISQPFNRGGIITQSILESSLSALISQIKQPARWSLHWLYRLRLRQLEIDRCFRKRRAKGVLYVCIPAYRSGSFISETLSSLSQQTYPHFQALVSIDGDDRETEKICLPFTDDPRIQVVVQQERLGWVQNTNWLLTHAKGDYIAILPHDDLIHPFYYEELIHYLGKHPECALVYSDTEAFSTENHSFRRFYFRQPSLKGEKFSRMKRYLSHALDCVGFRGVMPNWALDRSRLMENQLFEDFAADTLWMGEIVKKGELHRLTYPLCRKRYHSRNSSDRWFQQPKEVQKRAWSEHTAKLLSSFLEGESDSVRQKELMAAARARFKRACRRFKL